jgi:predicted protein tyrosine phosphatase
MPGQDTTHATIKSYKYTGGAIGAFLAVIAGANEDECQLPGGADVAGFLGFTMEAGGAGEWHPLHMLGGVAKATASAAIALGAKCSIAGASGKIKAAAPAAGVNSHVVCVALRAAAADGDVIPVLIAPSVMQG